MRWHWIDQIIEHEPGKRMVAIKNVSLAEDYLHDHFPAEDNQPPQPVMPASLMIEGMAQTAGIMVGAVHSFREKVILAKVVSAVLNADVGPGETIRYEATLDRIDPAGAATTGIVSRFSHRTNCWSEIGRIELMFSHIDQNLAGQRFPAENFVFGENFRFILAATGLALAPES